jgi:hypothetical protein
MERQMVCWLLVHNADTGAILEKRAFTSAEEVER